MILNKLRSRERKEDLLRKLFRLLLLHFGSFALYYLAGKHITSASGYEPIIGIFILFEGLIYLYR